MEGVLQICPALEVVRESLTDERFTLIDIGCSGGIDPVWRGFGDRLAAIGFDPNIEECERLQAQESNANVRYVAAFVALPPDHLFAIKKRGQAHIGYSPWSRLSAAKTFALHSKSIATMSSKEKTEGNFWRTAKLANLDSSIFLENYLKSAAITDIDFIKLDVDGPDFDILHSLENILSDTNVLGVCMEVNFHGLDNDTDHTLHNTDRFMRAQGFDLFHLTTRPYSAAALPSRFQLTIAAQTEFGRPFQGDALYVRDICNPANAALAARLSNEKILKTAAIFAVFRLPDCAAEILLAYRDRIAQLCDVDAFLDVLAAQAQEGLPSRLSYRDYIAQFEADADMFYPRKAQENVSARQSQKIASMQTDIDRLSGELEQTRAELRQTRFDRLGSTNRLGATRGSRLLRLIAPVRALFHRARR
jgi:hypothetical protein